MARALSKNQRYDPKKLDSAKRMRSHAGHAEAAMWEKLRGSRLLGWKFRRQQLMHGFIADFYCEEANLCVEIDGSFHDSPEAQSYDRFRDLAVSTKGIRVIRLSNEEVMAFPDQALSKIAALLGGPCPSRKGPRSNPPVPN